MMPFSDPDDDECSWQAVYVANRVQIPPGDHCYAREGERR
jgi:hypothetical protein